MIPDHVQHVLDRLDRVKRTGDGRWEALCPAHDDGDPSLSIGIGADGRVLLHCFAGCTPESIVAGIPLTMRDLFPPRETRAARLNGQGPNPKPMVTKIELAAEDERFRAAITDEHVARLAADLGVAPHSLRAIGIGRATADDLRRLGASGKGWSEEKPSWAYSFAERDGHGNIVGLVFRSPQGRKGAASRKAGSRRGLIIPQTGGELAGPPFAVEGPTDVAALVTLGRSAVGRPSCDSGVDDLAVYARTTEVVTVGENDEQEGGKWPGRDGARRTARQLAEASGSSARWVLPPDGVKDVREWVKQRVVGGLDISDPEDAGRAGNDLAQLLLAHCTEEVATRTPVKSGLVELGRRDPLTGRVVLSKSMTLPTARAYVEQFHSSTDGRTVHCCAKVLMVWRDNRYMPVEDDAVGSVLQNWLHGAMMYVWKPPVGFVLVPFESNPNTINSAVQSVKLYTHIPETTPVPSWLGNSVAKPDPATLLSCRSGNLHLLSNRVLAPTPLLFNTAALDFDYDPQAPEPVLWLRFLGQLWPDDPESIAALQEWFGYCLIVDTSQQKMLLMVGPRRSGKGTIARVLTRLVGAANVVGPTTSSLAGLFGLQPLLGKSLAIVSDARFHGEGIATVVERLLCISGEDTVTIDRKHLPAVTMKLPTRFMFLSNEVPRLTDASSALAGRFIVLRLIHSFYDKEDIFLTDKLAAELPGILRWAIEGWHRLRQRGRFIQAESGKQLVEDLEDLGSPVGAFVKERCVVGAGHRIDLDDLYAAWRQWCQEDGRTLATTKLTFGKDLAAAVPGVTRRRGTANRPFYEGIALKGGAF